MVVSAIDLIWPHKFSTILEVYYDTPYDRHVILEESHDVRYRKRNSRGLEDPPSLGSRILRYFWWKFTIFCQLMLTSNIK
jgi:dual oxidase maturation factor 1